MILAQATDFPSVPETTFKWVTIMLVGIALIAAALYAAFRKPEKQRVKIDDDPAVEIRKQPKRFNHDLSEHRFNDHERRIQALEKAREEFLPKLEAFRNELNLANEGRASRIHAHIEEDRKAIDEKVDGIFDRIIATLRNMGKI